MRCKYTIEIDTDNTAVTVPEGLIVEKMEV